jgi:hypothetical protein
MLLDNREMSFVPSLPSYEFGLDLLLGSPAKCPRRHLAPLHFTVTTEGSVRVMSEHKAGDPRKLFDALRDLVEAIESGNGRDDHGHPLKKRFAMREPSLTRLRQRTPDAQP